LSVKKAPSDVLEPLLESITTCLDAEDEACKHSSSLREQLEELISSNKTNEPLRSEHDQRNETLHTTVINKKVQLSKQKAALSKSDAAYSKILDDFLDWLVVFFKQRLVNLNTLFLREILIYDLRPAHRGVFAPKTRFAVERALSSPHDYLNCECCVPADGEGALTATQPSTAILYQLYLESGPLINVSDLWSAFSAIQEDENGEENAAMPHFQRALAELKYLGLIKNTRKKTDHVGKVLWKGL
jgi:origin recognition complex subunit 3